MKDKIKEVKAAINNILDVWLSLGGGTDALPNNYDLPHPMRASKAELTKCG